MDPAPPVAVRRKGRRLRRWLGGILALLILAPLASLLYLSQVGLPAPLQRHIQERIRTLGFELEMEEARWFPSRGMVARQVRLRSLRPTQAPLLRVAELAVDSSLDRMELRQATLELPGLSLEADIDQALLERTSEGSWMLRRLAGRMLHVELEIEATIRNPSLLAPDEQQEIDWEPWKRLAESISSHLASSPGSDLPRLKAWMDLDGADPWSARGRLELACESLRLPSQGEFRQVSLHLDLLPPRSPSELSVQGRLSAGSWRKDESGIRDLLLETLVRWTPSGLVQARWSADAGESRIGPASFPALSLGGLTRPASPGLESRMALAMPALHSQEAALEELELAATLVHQGADHRSASGSWSLKARNLSTPWASAPQASLSGRLGSQGTGSIGDRSLDLHASIPTLAHRSLALEDVLLDARWRSPRILVDRLSAGIGQGGLEVEATVDTFSRLLHLHSSALRVPLHQLAPLLPEKPRQWLGQYQFDSPPLIRASGQISLPQGGVEQDLLSTMKIDGSFRSGKGSFRSIGFSSASSTVVFEDRAWSLPDLHVVRPEGELRLSLRSDTLTKDHHWGFQGTIDPPALVPLLSPAQRKGLAMFRFPEPLAAQGTLEGRWRSPGSTRIDAEIDLSRFLFRKVEHSSLQARVRHAGRITVVTGARLQGPSGSFQARKVRIDGSAGTVAFEKGLSTLDPMATARMIGPSVVEGFRPYRFDRPPMVQVEGTIPFDGGPKADARFSVQGGPFGWNRFRSPRIETEVEWKGRQVRLHPFQAVFYGGTIQGRLDLELGAAGATPFALEARCREVDLNSLLIDLFPGKKQPTGRMEGQLRIDQGLTQDNHSWQGSGWARMDQGVLWDSPLFGIISKTLNALSPGLGNQKAVSGAGTFHMQEGALVSQDLAIELEPFTRVLYQGSVDYQGRLDARAEAQILREAPLLGREISIMLLPVSKLSVLRIGGTLEKPSVEPVLVLPKLLYQLFNASERTNGS